MADDDFRKQLTGDPIMSDLTRRYKRNALAISTLIHFSWMSGVELSSAKFFDIKPGQGAMYWGLLGLLIYTIFFFINGYRQDWRKWHDRFKVGLSHARLRYLFRGSKFERFIDTERRAENMPENWSGVKVTNKDQQLMVMVDGKEAKVNWIFPADSGRSLYISFWIWEVRFPQIVIGTAFLRLVYLICTQPAVKEIVLNNSGWGF